MKAGVQKTGIPAAFLVLTAIAWLYILLRAWFVQFSIDETATFFMYIQPGRFIPPYSTVDANNHILNSFLSWSAFKLLGSHPFAMRLPNVLAALVYFYFTWKIARSLERRWARRTLILLSLGTHFLIEFFGYCRGYGISMAGFTAALYYTIQLHRSFRFAGLLKSYLAILLVIFANFNLIFAALALLALTNTFAWLKRKFISWKSWALILLVNITIMLPAIAYVIFAAFQIRDHSGFYYGSGDGFFTVTVKSLSVMLAGKFWLIFAIYGLALLFAIITTMIFKLTGNKSSSRGSAVPALIFLFLIMVSWAGPVLLNFIWGVNFQEDRAAMHLIPLFFLLACFGMESLVKSDRSLYWLALLPMLLVPAYSFSRLSLISGIYGPRQLAPETYFNYISTIAEEMEYPPVVSAWQTRKQPWAFMNYRNGGRLNPIQSSAYPLPDADFIITEDELRDSMPDGFHIALENRVSRSILFERNEPSVFENAIISELDREITSTDKYANLFQFILPDDSVKNILVILDYEVESSEVPLEAVFVVEVFDPARKNLIYEAIDLDQLKPIWRENSGKFRHSLSIRGIPPEAESLVLYFWNKNAVPFNLRKGTAKLSF